MKKIQVTKMINHLSLGYRLRLLQLNVKMGIQLQRNPLKVERQLLLSIQPLLL